MSVPKRSIIEKLAKENVDRIKLVGLSKGDNLVQKENIAVFIEQERGVDMPELRLGAVKK
ncbi:MAG TPA: hypothetical protein IGS52_06525 [Oscillatoriaceae cyanobacterium M33_DOE_052]|nr:hypothetical protein [Oscillatoriaceae cyanobacterium M33_DOE_052]